MTNKYKYIFFVFLTLTSSLFVEGKQNSSRLFINQTQLNSFFEKLYHLESGKCTKINIVHFGDSHVQAGFFTNAIKKSLQSAFGDGGYGFTFPYKLARTNGPRDIVYTTNSEWSTWPNVKPWNDVGMGLGGIALYTTNNKFVIQLKTGYENRFSRIKVLYSTESPLLKLSITADDLKPSTTTTHTGQTHKIRSGESLSSIAQRYGTTITKLKRENNLKSDRISAGKVLRIPSRYITQITALPQENIKYEEMEYLPYFSIYSSNNSLDRATFFAVNDQDRYTINGFVLENDQSGIIYHSLGVNGAKLSDYNKYPLVFKQLQALEPDLIIISFGTNESFGKMSVQEYIYQLNSFIANIKEYNSEAQILVLTPPPSMFRRRIPNNYVSDYAVTLTSQSRFPVWDLFAHMGGLSGIKTGEFARLIAADKVHYSEQGYDRQGYMFASDLIGAYNSFKQTKKN